MDRVMNWRMLQKCAESHLYRRGATVDQRLEMRSTHLGGPTGEAEITPGRAASCRSPGLPFTPLNRRSSSNLPAQRRAALALPPTCVRRAFQWLSPGDSVSAKPQPRRPRRSGRTMTFALPASIAGQTGRQ